MTQFAYTAIPLQSTASGLVTGRREAVDERQLRAELRRSGLVAIDVRPVRLSDALRAALSADRPRRADAVWFFQTLRLLLASAVPIESALTTMHELSPNPRIRRACADVREKLRAGSPLDVAVGACPGLAAPQHVALLRTGHESGRLAHVVALIDASMTGSDRIRRTVVGRLIYPLILLIAAVMAVWFLATFVIPKFASTLETMGGTLPLSTSITMGAARIMVWALPPLLVVGVGAWLLRAALVPPSVKARLSRLALRMPLVGTLIWHSQAGVITDILATMIEGGGEVLVGLAQACEVVSSSVIGERLGLARQQVREGVDLGQALAQNKVLPPMVGAIVQVAIKGGDMVGGLRRATQACVETQERITERLLVLMEPAIVLFLAGAVGWVVYSLVMGMLAMNDLQGL